jgi:ABC-type amino acid transport substrate-binding protein
VRTDGSAELLVPRPDAFAGVDDLDAARLAHALRDVEHEARFEPDVDAAVAAVTSGRAEATVLVRPVGVPAIQQLAADRSLMPPKSTFFTPKLRTGLVFRPLDGSVS